MNELKSFIQEIVNRVSKLVGGDLQRQIQRAVSGLQRFSGSPDRRFARSSSPASTSFRGPEFFKTAAQLASRAKQFSSNSFSALRRNWAQFRYNRARKRFQRTSKLMRSVRASQRRRASIPAASPQFDFGRGLKSVFSAITQKLFWLKNQKNNNRSSVIQAASQEASQITNNGQRIPANSTVSRDEKSSRKSPSSITKKLQSVFNSVRVPVPTIKWIGGQKDRSNSQGVDRPAGILRKLWNSVRVPVPTIKWISTKSGEPQRKSPNESTLFGYLRSLFGSLRSKQSTNLAANPSVIRTETVESVSNKESTSTAEQKPKTNPVLGWIAAVNNWITAHHRNWYEGRVERQHESNRDALNKAKQALERIEKPQPKKSLERIQEASERHRDRKDRDQKYDQTSPEALLKQILAMNQRKSGKRSLFRANQPRKSMLGQIGQARSVALRAARRYQAASSKVTRAQAILANAKKRFNAAPSPGQSGYNPQRISSLYQQYQIAQGHLKAMQGGQSHALQQLKQAASLLSSSTSIRGGLMKSLPGMLNVAGRVAGGAGVVTAVARAPSAIQSIGESFVESRRDTRDYSAKAGVMFNNYDVFSDNLKRHYSGATASGNQRFIDQLNKFRQNILPFQEGLANLASGIGTVGMVVANAPFDLATDFGIFTQAVQNGQLGDFWNFRKKAWEEKQKMDKEEMENNLPKSVFQGVMEGWKSIADDRQTSLWKGKDEFRFNSRPKDILPPLK